MAVDLQELQAIHHLQGEVSDADREVKTLVEDYEQQLADLPEQQAVDEADRGRSRRPAIGLGENFTWYEVQRKTTGEIRAYLHPGNDGLRLCLGERLIGTQPHRRRPRRPRAGRARRGFRIGL